MKVVLSTVTYQTQIRKAIVWSLLAVYIFLLLKVIVFKTVSPFIVFDNLTNHLNGVSLKRTILFNSNFIPFKTIFNYIFVETNKMISIINIAGNIILFMPFGFILPLCVARQLKFKSIIFRAFLLSFLFELMQLFLGIGSFDVDDLLLNSFGGLLGFIIFKVLLFILKSINRRLQGG